MYTTPQNSNFYEGWLNHWEKAEQEKKMAKKAIHADELQWTRTRQDYKAALMVAPETGFRTWGGITMIAEIPPGWHTGSHSHGEEAIYVLKGRGFSIIDDRAYDWEVGSCISIPFGSVHQHFNDGDEPVQYLSAMCPHLEYFCGISKFEQYEDCGKTSSAAISRPKTSAEDVSPSDRRLVLRKNEMKITHGGEERAKGAATLARFLDSMPEATRKAMYSGNKDKGMTAMQYNMMGSRPDFYGEEAEITHVFHTPAGEISGKHAHMEAILYVLDGEVNVTVDDETVSCRPGTSLHVQGPQTAHQIFNTGGTENRLLRIHFGIRSSFFQGIAKKKFPYLFLESRRQM